MYEFQNLSESEIPHLYIFQTKHFDPSKDVHTFCSLVPDGLKFAFGWFWFPETRSWQLTADVWGTFAQQFASWHVCSMKKQAALLFTVWFSSKKNLKAAWRGPSSETLGFKYSLWFLAFFSACPNPESKCRSRRPNHRSLCFVFLQMQDKHIWGTLCSRMSRLFGGMWCFLLPGRWNLSFFDCSRRAGRERLRSGSSSSPVVWPPTVMLSCFWEEGFFSASLSFPNASSQPFPLFQSMPHFATQTPVLSLQAVTPPRRPSLCDWLLFDNWPLLVLLFEPTIV